MKYPDMTWSRMQAVVDKLGGEEGVERFLRGESTITIVSLLRQVATATTSAVMKFSAKDTFGAKKPAVKLWLGDTFKRVMLSKVEDNISAAELTAHTLAKDSLDAPILAELGNSAEVSLAYIWELLAKQRNGESGFLLTNGYANIFYVRGTDGNLWAVYAHWFASGGGWNVEAYSVVCPDGWGAGRQVVSRK